METVKEARSGTASENLQEILDAGISAKHATLGGQQQYELPVEFASVFNGLLPQTPRSVFDPQVAGGNLVKCGIPNWVKRFGWEIDKRFEDRTDGVMRAIGNCVDIWAILDEVFPELKFQAQNANPPFGIIWKTPDGKADSTEFTWRNIMKRAHNHGFGFFVSNYKTIERLGIDKHPFCYLYQRFPAGVWRGVEVEIGVVHWDAHPKRFPREAVVYETLDLSEHAKVLARVKAYYHEAYQFTSPKYIEREAPEDNLSEAWQHITEILHEERSKRPPYNIYLDGDGMLRTYLSTRFTLKRKLKREEVLRVATIDKQHPLTLTTDRESRKLMADLVNCGIYTIQDQAKAAIEAALAEVNRLAAPIMPVTEFETVAYADEEDHLECVLDYHDASRKLFSKGKRYELRTASYKFQETFKRNKPHYREGENGDDGEMYTLEHTCTLSGSDRYIQIEDDHGESHRFMDRPQYPDNNDHDEATLWRIFKRPVVKTVAETHPEVVENNKITLSTCELLADFSFFGGQLDYLARVAVKDYGIIAAATGAGKSLMAISLVQVKGPKRALIIAPQGTMRTSKVEEEDEDDEQEEAASQWIAELRKFAPGLPVFQLFSMADYQRILELNNGVLPHGVYVSYYEAMFVNGAREQCPDTWNDERLEQEMQNIIGSRKAVLPENPPRIAYDPKKSWCNTIGKEGDNGIRCIITPCMASLIGHHFDMVCLDEAHRACNLEAITTKMVIRLQPKYRYLFTATPIPNVVSNLFPLMGWTCVPDWYKGERRNAAWPYARNELQRFIDQFQSIERDHTQESMNDSEALGTGRWKKRSSKCVKVSPIISSPARLLKILKPNMAYISKPMCNPKYKEPKLVDVRVDFGDQQARLYEHFMDRGNIACKNYLVRARKQISYLRNICADPAGFSHGGPRVKSNFNPKTVAILELARDIINRGDPVILVFARKGQSNTIHTALRDAGVLVSRIDSTIPAEQHSHQSNLFKSGKTQAMVMGIKCAVAHSYSECPWMIIGSLEYSWGSLDQARGRIDRVNSKYDRTIYCVLNRCSLEEVIFDVVATKQDAATICLQGKRVPRTFKPVDMGEVLAEALDEFKDMRSEDEIKCELAWPKLRDTFKPKG